MEDAPTDGGSVKNRTPLEAEKIAGGTAPLPKPSRQRAYSERMTQVRAVLLRLDETEAWDSIQAKELPPELIEHVEIRFKAGWTPGEIAKELGLNRHGGKNSRQWKKIQAFFRMGFRADAEGHLVHMTSEFFKVIQKAKEVLDDAFENGVPIVEQTVWKDKDGCKQIETKTHLVKGATKELGSFLEAYAKVASAPMKLWKEYGAIGEAQGGKGGHGSGGITIVVKTNVPSRSQEEIDAYRAKLSKVDEAIDVTKESSVVKS